MPELLIYESDHQQNGPHMWMSVEPSRAMSYNHNIRLRQGGMLAHTPHSAPVVTGSVNRERGEEMVAPFPEIFIAVGRSVSGGEIKWMIMDSEKEGDDFLSPRLARREEGGLTEGLCRRRRKSAQIVKYWMKLLPTVVSFGRVFRREMRQLCQMEFCHPPSSSSSSSSDRTKLLIQTNGLCQPSIGMGCLEWRGLVEEREASEASHTYLLRGLFAQLLFADSFRTKESDCFVSRSATTFLARRPHYVTFPPHPPQPRQLVVPSLINILLLCEYLKNTLAFSALQ